MEITTRKLALIIVPLILVCSLLCATTLYVFMENYQIVIRYNSLVDEYNALIKLLGGEATFDVGQVLEIHSQIRIWQGDTLILDEWNAGAVTDLGDNMTLFFIFGDTDMQYGDIAYSDNATYISIGNQGTLTTSSVVLPGEWNRTTAIVEDEDQSQLNLTCTFYPDSGPYTADCIGINLNGTATANNLIMYDTFSEVTGIDDTFTINVEFQISEAHS